MIVKKKEKSSKKICFSTPEDLFMKYKNLKKIANENGLDIEINLELQKFFQKLIRKAEKDLEELLKEEKNKAKVGEYSVSDDEPEM
jgi:hypothetical protein